MKMQLLRTSCLLWLVSLSVAEFVDLTHEFDQSTITWPTTKPFNITWEFRGMDEGGYWYELEDIAASTHSGTHMDAPAHFSKGKWHIEDIPIRHFIGPLVLLDIKARAAVDPVTEVQVSDIQKYEEKYGRIPNGAMVVMDSGWTSRWPDKKLYLGTDTKNEADLKFPGFSVNAVRWLILHRKVYAVGVDTPSLDHGPSKDFKCHQLLFEQNIYGLENVALKANVPPSGATLMAMPMKIKGGSGAPCRITAMWGDDAIFLSKSAALSKSTILLLWMCLFVIMLR